jgi:hypothetical protein
MEKAGPIWQAAPLLVLSECTLSKKPEFRDFNILGGQSVLACLVEKIGPELNNFQY